MSSQFIHTQYKYLEFDHYIRKKIFYGDNCHVRQILVFFNNNLFLIFHGRVINGNILRCLPYQMTWKYLKKK